MSRWYDLIAGDSEKKFTDAGLQLLHAQNGESILEIGYGTGWSIIALAKAVGESGKVYGLDLSEGMYRITSQRVANAGLSERVVLNCDDAVKLPFETDFFDAVFMSFTLELFDTPEIPTVLYECRRVLHNGGRISVVSMAKKANPSLIVRLYEWAHEKIPNYVDCRPIYASLALQQAGFEIITAKEMIMWGLPVDLVLAQKP
jgi:ubiquinone/menaquinone biosynthesis C-methylase UbiE